MKRADALAAMVFAGYHADRRTWVRLFCEHRISRSVADEAYRRGVQHKAEGRRCGCSDCTTASVTVER